TVRRPGTGQRDGYTNPYVVSRNGCGDRERECGERHETGSRSQYLVHSCLLLVVVEQRLPDLFGWNDWRTKFAATPCMDRSSRCASVRCWKNGRPTNR